MTNFKYKYIILLFSLLYTSTFVLWKQWVDVSWWMNNSHLYYEDFMNCLSLWIGYLWMQVMGQEAVTYRFLGWIISMASICLVYLGTQPKDTWYKNLNCLSLGIVIFGCGTFQIYNPDSASLLSLSALSVYVIKHKLTAVKEILVASLLTALAAASRFPNIVVVSFVVMYMCFTNFTLWKIKKAKCISHVLLYCAAFIAIYYILTCCICQTFNVVSLALDSITSFKAADESHDFGNLLINGMYSSTVAWLLVCGCIGYIAFLGMMGFNDKSPLWMKILFPWGVVFLLLYPAWVGMFDGIVKCYYRTASFASAFLLLYMAHKSNDKNVWIKSLFLIGVGFSASAGSNTSIIKMYPVMMSLLPIAFCYFKSYFNKSLIVKSYTFAATFAAMIGVLHSLAENLTPIDLPNNRYQFVDKKLAFNMHQLYSEYKKCCPNNERALFYGDTESHRMYMITSNILPFSCDFWPTVENRVQVQKLINELKIDSTYTLFIYDKAVHESFEQSLLEAGYSFHKETNTFRVYKHK